MALRTPLTAQPHLYIGDSTGRPLDYGRVYFGEPNKDPEFYPIDIYLDPEMTIAAAQPVRTKGGFMDVGGDLAELHAAEVTYSLKVLDQYGRQVFYKPEMYRNNVSDFLVDEITRATAAETLIAGNLTAETQRATAAEKVIADAVVTEKDRAIAAEAALDVKHAALSSTINSLGGGKKAYTTYALMVADKNNIAANSSIDVTNDTDPLKNGTYSYDGAVFAKSIYDVETIVRTKVLNTFKTKALMDASALPDGADAQVTDDSVAANNGLYVKTAGTWVKSAYDPLTQAKAYADTAKSSAINTASLNADITAKAVFKENDAGQYFDASAFSIEAYYNIHGQYNTGSPFLQTSFVAVKKGDVITASTGMPDRYPWAVMFDTSQTRTDNLGIVTERVFKERTATVTQDGFVVIQHASTIEPADVPKFEINKGKSRYVELTKLADNDAIKAKADKIKLNYFTDFEVGGVSSVGDKTSETDRIRSKSVYKLKAGTVIKFGKMTNNYLFGVAARTEADYASGKLPFATYVANNASPGYTFTVTADAPYVMVFVRANSGGINPITPDDIPTILEDVKIWTEESVTYTSPIVAVSGVASTTGYLPPITTPSPFRTSSLATGGVISFIDDDGKAEVLTGLHPFMKGEGVPYGEAIVPARLNTDGYMTTEQFLQLANETEHVEILDHTFSHFNLSSATKERIEGSLLDSKKFFASNGVVVDSLVYPFGGDDEPSRAIVSKYYQSAFDYGGGARVETFDTISNRSIKRTTWQGNSETLANHKARIDEAAATDGWLVVCLHVGANNYWYENSYAELSELIAYARTKGLRFAMPRDGFQIFGNIAENDSGFKIQANGKIVGAS